MLSRVHGLKLMFLGLSVSLALNSWAATGVNTLTAKHSQHGSLTGNSIFGGTPAAAGEFPFYAGLFSTVSGNSQHLWCGSALIAPNWLITAHHCVKSYDDGSDIPITKIIVNLWRFDTTKNTYQPAIEGTYLYSTAPSYVGNDLALIKLKNPINDAQVPPVVLSTRRLDAGQPVTAVGMGRNGANKIPDQLHKAEIQVLQASYCKDGDMEPKREVCAGTPISAANQQGTANGDSGGPLLVKDGGIWKSDATVSRIAFYEENNRSHDLAIYSEISSDDFKRWIQSTTNESVRYTCSLEKVTDEGVSIYQLESCAAAGDWSNGAPYLVKASQQLKDCHYDPGRKTWVCPDKDTPIYHYKTYFSAPVLQADGRYQTQATVPLTELGN